MSDVTIGFIVWLLLAGFLALLLDWLLTGSWDDE